jgi:hypothetical protein
MRRPSPAARSNRREAAPWAGRSGRVRLLRSTSLALLLCAEVAVAAEPSRRDGLVHKPVVTARGRDRSEITVEAFGRFAIFAQSKTGVELQLVDKIAGPGATSGSAGRVDGRIDQFLDRGQYLVLTKGDDRARGEAKLELRGFQEVNASSGKLPRLVELKPIDTTLGDFEQRSYWLELPTARTVVIEAAGRDLADLRIWKDGTWLVLGRRLAEGCGDRIVDGHRSRIPAALTTMAIAA